MTHHVPSNLTDLASPHRGKSSFPNHVHYQCRNLLPNIADDLTYDGNDVQAVEVYFGVNDQETRERRNIDGWSHSDEHMNPGEAGPLLIDVIVYFLIDGQTGEYVSTNFYTDEPAEFISTATYEELLRDHARSAIKSTPQIE